MTDTGQETEDVIDQTSAQRPVDQSISFQGPNENQSPESQSEQDSQINRPDSASSEQDTIHHLIPLSSELSVSQSTLTDSHQASVSLGRREILMSPSTSGTQRTLSNFFVGRRQSQTISHTQSRPPVRGNPPLPVFNPVEVNSVTVPIEEVINVTDEDGTRSPEIISSDEDSRSSVQSEDGEGVLPGSPIPGDVPGSPTPGEEPAQEMNVRPEPPATSHQSGVDLTNTTGSPGDFRTPKRRRMMSSPDKTGNTAEEDDGNSCPICFEEWSTSGSHRLASLKCGHLFGQSCIEKWLKGQGGKCPQCNAKAKRQDIRQLYAKSLKAVDTSERDRALQDLEKEKEARRKTEMEAAQTRLQYQLAIEECNRLKTELDKVKKQLQSARSSETSPGSSQSQFQSNTDDNNGHFVLDKTIKIWEAGNCRVMSYSPSLATLVVSQPSASPLFPGFGFKKLSKLNQNHARLYSDYTDKTQMISAMDFKTSQYLTAHSKHVRDCSFHPFVDDGILLSCGLDKTAKMTSVISNTVVQTYDLPNPVWSCVWNADDRNLFYAGQANGNVMEFDIRNTANHVQELNREGSRSPVVSLQYIPKDLQADFRLGGLIVGQLNRISFYEKKADNEYRLHMLPLEGNLSSLCFEYSTRHLLASFRPTSKHPTSRHQVCEMTSVNLSTDPTVIDNGCSCHIVHTFHGSQTQTVLARSLLLPQPGHNSRMLVCAGVETSSGIHIWDTGSGQLRQRIAAGGIVVDTCVININQQTFLAALTDKTLRVHRWC